MIASWLSMSGSDIRFRYWFVRSCARSSHSSSDSAELLQIPVASSHQFSVHGSPSWQFTGIPTQRPPEQTSLFVHRTPSLQSVPSCVITRHWPVVVSHRFCWHALSCDVSQVTGVPRHCVASQRSFRVQALPSLQVFVFATWRQPTAGSHESSVHGLWSSQVTASVTHCPASHRPARQRSWGSQSLSAPTQAPSLSQASSTVQASPSSQARPRAATKRQPTPASHWSSVQPLWSSHVTGSPVHAVPEQRSSRVQASPSSHASPASAAACVHTPFEPQWSSVQGLSSSQSMTSPTQRPVPSQRSDTVQTS